MSTSAKLNWQDETTYGRGQRGNIAPRTWGLTLAGIQIIVTQHIKYGNQWTLYCPVLDYKTNKGLGTEDVEEAKDRAVRIILDAAEKRRDNLNSLIDILRFRK